MTPSPVMRGQTTSDRVVLEWYSPRKGEWFAVTSADYSPERAQEFKCRLADWQQRCPHHHYRLVRRVVRAVDEVLA